MKAWLDPATLANSGLAIIMNLLLCVLSILFCAERVLAQTPPPRPSDQNHMIFRGNSKITIRHLRAEPTKRSLDYS